MEKTPNDMSGFLRHFSTLAEGSTFLWRETTFTKTGVAIAEREHDRREFDFISAELVEVESDGDNGPEPLEGPFWEDDDIYDAR